MKAASEWARAQRENMDGLRGYDILLDVEMEDFVKRVQADAIESAAEDLDVATSNAETPMLAAGYGMAAIRIRALKPATGGQGVRDGV